MGVQINEVYRIEFNGQVIIGTHEELEELCLALEEVLYEDPTYEELNEKITALEHENECLKGSLEHFRSEADERI